MKKEVNSILEEVLDKINPSKEELGEIDLSLKKFLKELNKKLKQKKVRAEIFLGGSYAKKTIIKKDKYDIDIFIRFDKKYSDKNISKVLEGVLKSLKIKYKTLKGSRNYFRIDTGNNLFFELVPVLKTKNPKEAENITDLSYMHVKYVNKKIRSKKILQDIKIAKSFCHAQKCYGAESYINGFSGYSLELLIYYYKGFLNFIKEISKADKSKIIIDMEKLHRNKKNVLLDINESKLGSPMILVDPTYKYRNVLAALNDETFFKFQNICKRFLKNPSIEFFLRKKVDYDKLKKNSENKGYEFILLNVETIKQPGDIAGSKLKKFYRHLSYELKKYFEIKNSEFDYLEEKNAKFFFSVKPRKSIFVKGPKIKDKKNVNTFKKLHKKKNEKLVKKSGRICLTQKIDFSLRDFILKWKKENEDKIKSMSIISMNFLN